MRNDSPLLRANERTSVHQPAISCATGQPAQAGFVAHSAPTPRRGFSRQPIHAALHRQSLERIAWYAVAALILALCAVFHTWRLGQTPGWDPQEGYNLDIAWNLAHGQLRLFALRSAFAQHPPLFYLQLALAIRLFGYSITALRALVAFYATLACGALLWIGRRLIGPAPTLWAALVYTVAPVTLANTRWGYSYAQLAFVGLLCLGATWRAVTLVPRDASETTVTARRWLWLAAGLAGLAAFSDYEGIAWVVFVALAALSLGVRTGGWRLAGNLAGRAVALGLSVPLVGLALCWLAAPTIFPSDMLNTLMRVGGGNPLIQAIDLLLNYYRFVTLDPWLTLGLIGLLFVRQRPVGALLPAAIGLLALVSLAVRLIGTSLHTVTPLLPLLALGAGAAFDAAARAVRRLLLRWFDSLFAPVRFPSPAFTLLLRMLAALVVFVVVASPLALATATDVTGLAATLPTAQDAYLATPADAQSVATYIYSHASSGDLVLASPQIAWLFDHPPQAPSLAGADILQTLAQSGQAAAFYPANLPTARWAYRVTLDRASYVVMDNLIRLLATPDQLPALIPVLAHITRWPVVFSQGQYTVYAAPQVAKP